MKTLIRGISIILFIIILGPYNSERYATLLSSEHQLTIPNLDQESNQKLHDQIFVNAAVIKVDGMQSGTVIVRDAQNQPIKAAKVTVSVIYPGGGINTYSFGLTDSNGVVYFFLPQHELEVGRAILTSEVVYQNKTSTSSTSFLIWY